MSEKKSSTVLLTVIGIATLLVTLVGATFAFFTADINDVRDENAGDDVVITAANLGTINFAHGNNIVLNNALPGAKDTKEFTISAPDSTVTIDYVIYLDTTKNEIGKKTDGTPRVETENLVATLTKPTDNANTTSLITAAPLKTDTYVPDKDETTRVEIGRGTLAAHGSDTWILTVELLEKTVEQNDDQGRIYEGNIVVEAAQYTQTDVYK